MSFEVYRPDEQGGCTVAKTGRPRKVVDRIQGQTPTPRTPEPAEKPGPMQEWLDLALFERCEVLVNRAQSIIVLKIVK